MVSFIAIVSPFLQAEMCCAILFEATRGLLFVSRPQSGVLLVVNVMLHSFEDFPRSSYYSKESYTEILWDIG